MEGVAILNRLGSTKEVKCSLQLQCGGGGRRLEQCCFLGARGVMGVSPGQVKKGREGVAPLWLD